MKHLEPTGIPVLSRRASTCRSKTVAVGTPCGLSTLWTAPSSSSAMENCGQRRVGEGGPCGVWGAGACPWTCLRGRSRQGAWRCEVDLAGDIRRPSLGGTSGSAIGPSSRTSFTVVATGPTCPRKPKPTSKARAEHGEVNDQQRQFAEAVHGGRGDGRRLPATASTWSGTLRRVKPCAKRQVATWWTKTPAPPCVTTVNSC